MGCAPGDLARNDSQEQSLNKCLIGIAAIVMAFVIGFALLLGGAPPAIDLSDSKTAGGSSALALMHIPHDYLAWYLDAAKTCPGLPWSVLAGIGTVESDNGRSDLPGAHSGANSAGAEGPMQFEPATFARYAVNASHRGRPGPYDPADAIYTAAAMLCANGAASGKMSGLRRAILAYNHSRR
jgi:hypothetical protein